MMAIYDHERLLSLLLASGAELNDGLSDTEFAAIENQFGFHFGPDHREFLALSLPTGDHWVDWRHGSPDDIRARLDWPTDGVLFDVEHNDFWPGSIGERPGDLSLALELAREYMSGVPQLIPIFSHRYLLAAPCGIKSPVFSCYQTDVIYYGSNLENHLARELQGAKAPVQGKPLHIPFWSDLAESRADKL